jgi:hypothetical protein
LYLGGRENGFVAVLDKIHRELQIVLTNMFSKDM